MTLEHFDLELLRTRKEKKYLTDFPLTVPKVPKVEIPKCLKKLVSDLVVTRKKAFNKFSRHNNTVMDPVTQQPTTNPDGSCFRFEDIPANVTCQYCNHQVTTRTTKEKGACTWVA